MEFYSIKGGNPLCGEVDIAGAKNAALPILSAAIMTNETVLVENVPDVSDIRAILSAIESIGAIVATPSGSMGPGSWTVRSWMRRSAKSAVPII